MKQLPKKVLPLAYGQYFNLLSRVAPGGTAKRAFSLLSKVRKGRVLEHQKAYLDGARHETPQIGAHRIQTYRWSGNGPTVLLVHGWESNTFRWRNLIAKLREKGFNILAFDGPGHGYSSGRHLYAPLYAEVLEGLLQRYAPDHLVGHSMAGMTILYNEHLNPSPTVEKIVTVAAPSEFYEITEHYQRLLRFDDRVLHLLDDYVYHRFGFRIREFSTSEFVRTNTKKGLLFHDRSDRIAPFHASKKVHENWKLSELVATDGLGHSMHQEAVNDRIAAFLLDKEG